MIKIILDDITPTWKNFCENGVNYTGRRMFTNAWLLARDQALANYGASLLNETKTISVANYLTFPDEEQMTLFMIHWAA